MNWLEQWGIISLIVVVLVFLYIIGGENCNLEKVPAKFDKLVDLIVRGIKLPWKVFTTVLGILFIIGVIAMWLGFFGIIPAGSPPDDGHNGRYTNEMYDPFR